MHYRFIRRKRIREMMTQAGIGRATPDFYETFDQAVGSAMIQIVSDLGNLYPDDQLTAKHLERMSINNGGYRLDFVPPGEETAESDEEVEIDADDLDSLDDIEDD